MIRIEDLQFSYDDAGFALAVPAWRVTEGKRVALVGPSGCGKTTLLSLLAGILCPGRGKVTVGDTVVSNLPDARRRDFRIARIGFVFQDFELLDYLSVEENLLLPYLINPSMVMGAEERDRAAALAQSVGLGDRLNRSVTQLSQGEKQRVAICRAMVTRPQLILADEPTGNLDPDTKEHILKLLFAHATEAGTTMVMVTHDHGLLEGFDEVVDFAKNPWGEGGES